MKEADPSRLLAGGLSFYGRITANLSHEINNVVAIIGEAWGLLEDHLAMAERGRPLDVGKIRALSGNIGRQVQRGTSIVRHMNFLGHSVDDARAEIDLDLTAEHVAGLSRRIAEQKGAAVELERSDVPVIAVCDPFLTLQAAFLCIDMALKAGAVSEPIRVTVVAGAEGPCLSVESAGFEPGGRGSDTLSYVGTLMAGMGGEATVAEVGGRRAVRLRFLRPAGEVTVAR